MLDGRNGVASRYDMRKNAYTVKLDTGNSGWVKSVEFEPYRPCRAVDLPGLADPLTRSPRSAAHLASPSTPGETFMIAAFNLCIAPLFTSNPAAPISNRAATTVQAAKVGMSI